MKLYEIEGFLQSERAFLDKNGGLSFRRPQIIKDEERLVVRWYAEGADAQKEFTLGLSLADFQDKFGRDFNPESFSVVFLGKMSDWLFAKSNHFDELMAESKDRSILYAIAPICMGWDKQLEKMTMAELVTLLPEDVPVGPRHYFREETIKEIMEELYEWNDGDRKDVYPVNFNG